MQLVYVNLQKTPSGVLVARPVSKLYDKFTCVLSEEQSQEVLTALQGHALDASEAFDGLEDHTLYRVQRDPYFNFYLTVSNHPQKFAERLNLVVSTYTRLLVVDLGAVEDFLRNQNLYPQELEIAAPEEKREPLPWED